MWVSSPEAKGVFEKGGRRGLMIALVAVVALAFAVPGLAEAAASSDHWYISRDRVVKVSSDKDTITFEDESVPLGELAEEEKPAEIAEKPKTKRRSTVKIGDDFPGGFNIEIHEDYDGSDDIVRFGEHIVIEEDEEVMGDVVAIGGSIDVRGKVMGDVVSVGGSLNVAPTGGGLRNHRRRGEHRRPDSAVHIRDSAREVPGVRAQVLRARHDLRQEPLSGSLGVAHCRALH
jgi:hypothetical protein